MPGHSASAPDAITPETLDSLTYSVGGLEGTDSVTLTDGSYIGQNYEMKVEVYLIDAAGNELSRGSPIVTADLDGDGHNEAVVIVHSWLGGTGQFHNLAVVGSSAQVPAPAGRPAPRMQELASIPLGDRVNVDSVRLVQEASGPLIRVALLAKGPGDGGCCPTYRSLWDFRFRRGAGTSSTLELVRDSLLDRDSTSYQ